ncbi:unnamed protein product [Lasius platythorax]|uniref:Uncharacterized protein n=1 Tax=Lasius platythorax TaxID=488582 RepID=A0AAV2N4E7_9HYME
MAAKEGGSRSRNLGNRRGVLGFHLRRALNVARRARVDGVAGGWLRTAGFSSTIIMEQQQSDDLNACLSDFERGFKSIRELSRICGKYATLTTKLLYELK